MTVSASTQIPKPSDPAVFQRQCKVLFEQVLRDPNVQEFGSSGQAQNGVDLLGRRRDGPVLDHWVGVQCKLTIKADKLKKGTVRDEATAALAFKPDLKEYIVATTADDDVAMHAEAAAVTDEQAKGGRDFTVQVWGWQTLQTHILQYQAAIDAFSPDAFPLTRQIAKGQERLTESVDIIATDQRALVHAVQRIEQRIATSTSFPAPPGVWDDSSIGTLLDRQIDQYRDMLNAGRPRTARGLLEALWSALPPGADNRIRFRVRANIAACKLRLADEEGAGDDYLEAHGFTPDDPKAAALKVLGLLLLKRPTEAREFGIASLSLSGDRGALVAHTITAARQDGSTDNDLVIIPPDLETNAAVEVARIDYLRFRPELGSWTESAREARTRHPDDKYVGRLAAEADLADAAAWSDDNGREILPPDIRTAVDRAVTVLRLQWDETLQSEAAWDDFAATLCANLTTGYRLLHDADSAMAIVTKGLERAPEDPALLERQFVIALERGDSALGARLLDRMPPSRDKVFGQLQIFVAAGDWAAIDALAGTDIADYEIGDQAYFDSLVLLARCELRRIDSPRDAAADLLSKYPDQAIVPIVLYEAARLQKDRVWASDLYQTALSRRASFNPASRVMLARIAEREDDPEIVVDTLYGHVDTARDSEELRSLARGFVNAHPRKIALDFVRSLTDDLKATPFYARVAGSIHFNSGALDEAADAFQIAIRADSTDLVARLGLINVWLRQDRKDLVEEHLGQIDLARISGSPVHKMGLAQLLATFGRPADGLKLGYETALASRDELRVAQLYIGLILPDPTGALVPPIGPDAQVDCWIRLIDNGHVLNVVIEEGADRPAIDHYGPAHPLAKAVLGRKIGDIVTLTPPLGSERSWRIAEIKHKYIALLHDIMETLPTRFPEARGFYQFEIKEGDLSPILDQVKSLSEHQDVVLDNYLQNGFPLALSAAILGKCTVEFAANVVARGKALRTCVGVAEEREEAFGVIRDAAERGAVLDTYAAWVAQELGLIPVLKSMFKRVVLPRSSLDELREWRSRFQPGAPGEPLMTIAYVDGQYVRQEFPAERLAETVEAINSAIAKLETELEIVPGLAPGAPSELEAAVLKLAHQSVFDPAYVAVADDLLILSEDLHYRNLVRSLYQRPGAWLQAALMLAADNRKLNMPEYATAVWRLAAQKHDYISLNAPTLLEIAKSDDTDGLLRFKAATEFIATPAADFTSHFSVSWDSLLLIWDAELPGLRREVAASAILDRLVKLLARYDQLKPAYLKMIQGSARKPLLRDYLIAWARGHFLNIV